MAVITSYNGPQSLLTNILDGNIAAKGQSFNVATNSYTLDSIAFRLLRVGNPTGTCHAEVYAHAGTYGTSSVGTGSPLAASDTIALSSISTSLTTYTFTFTGTNKIALAAGTNYVFVVAGTANNASNYIRTRIDTATLDHSGNYTFKYSSTWGYQSTSEISYFVVNGTVLPTILSVDTVSTLEDVTVEVPTEPLSVSLDDSITVVDTSFQEVALGSGIVDTTSVSEALQFSLDSFITVTDTSSVSEVVISEALLLSVLPYDGIVVTESIGISQPLSDIVVYELAGVVEEVTAVVSVASVSAVDSIVTADVVAVTLSDCAVSAVEVVTIADFVYTVQELYFVNISDSAVSTETVVVDQEFRFVSIFESSVLFEDVTVFQPPAEGFALSVVSSVTAADVVTATVSTAEISIVEGISTFEGIEISCSISVDAFDFAVTLDISTVSLPDITVIVQENVAAVSEGVSVLVVSADAFVLSAASNVSVFDASGVTVSDGEISSVEVVSVEDNLVISCELDVDTFDEILVLAAGASALSDITVLLHESVYVVSVLGIEFFRDVLDVSTEEGVSCAETVELLMYSTADILINISSALVLTEAVVQKVTGYAVEGMLAFLADACTLDILSEVVDLSFMSEPVDLSFMSETTDLDFVYETGDLVVMAESA